MGSKKRKRHRATLRQLAIQSACLIVPLLTILLILIDFQPWMTHVLAWSFPFCFWYIMLYNWFTDKKSSLQVKRIKLMANLLLLGDFITVFPLWLYCKDPSIWAHFALIYGMYTLIVGAYGARHFVCAMQALTHQPMKPYAPLRDSERRKGMAWGAGYVVVGIILFYIDKC